MIKADIVNKVAEASEISRVKAAQAVDTVIEGLRNALARGQRIELRGFGVFQVKQRKKGIGRNPKTGVEVKIPPGNTIDRKSTRLNSSHSQISYAVFCLKKK